MNAITDHITACLDNISPAALPDDLDGEVKSFARQARARSGQVMTGW
jgi:hypothetical protein